jgi:predicted DCC family thiol-disulfide oxidoreductase YuxK
MALAARIDPSWNPLRNTGTALPPNLLLMAKLIALCLLLTNHVRLLPEPFLPFLPVFDYVPGAAFQWTLRIVFLASALALLFNRSARVMSAALGLTILVGVLSSRAYYGNNKTFCGLLLLLTGLYAGSGSRWLVRWQVAIVYLGAGINKALDGDWQNGQFFAHWAGARLKNPLYLFAAPLLPALWLAKLACWTTIAVELVAATALLIPRLYPIGMWASILLQCGLLEFTGSTFTMFFFAMQAAMLAFVAWPREQWTVLWDGECGFCARSKRIFEAVDFDGLFAWAPYQSGFGRKHGVSDEDAQQRMYLFTPMETLGGFRAWRKMLLFTSATYFVLAVLIAGAPAGAVWWRRIVVGGALLFFSPPFIPAGEAAYNWVARNRHRLSRNSACALPDKP